MDKKQILIASKKSIAGWSAYNSLFQNKCAFPDKDFSNDYGNVMTAFKNGQVAMIVNGPWSTADVLSGPQFKNSTNFQVAVHPAGTGRPGLADRRRELRDQPELAARDRGVHVHQLADGSGAAGGLRDQEQPPAEPRLRVQAAGR